MIHATELQRLLDLHTDAHSDWQITAAIIQGNGYGHPYGNLKQALRELNSRHAIIADSVRQIELAEMDLARTTWRLRWRLTLSMRRLHIRADQQAANIRAAKRRLADLRDEYSIVLRETKRWAGVCGAMTPERRRELDGEMWLSHYKIKILCEVLRNGIGRLSTALLRDVILLPVDMREKVLAIAGSKQAQMHLFAEYQILPPTGVLAVADHSEDDNGRNLLAGQGGSGGTGLDLHRNRV